MKKMLLLLPLLAFVLVGCDPIDPDETTPSDTQTVEPTDTTTVTDSDITTDPTDIIIPERTVVLTFAVSGIETYEGNHEYIWINSPISKENVNGDWGASRLVQDEDNEHSWTISFENIEVDQIFEYNLYYGGDSVGLIQWTGINQEGTSTTPRNFRVTEDDYEFLELVATFVLPSTSRTVKLTSSPKVGPDAAPLSDGNYLWAWTSLAGTIKFTNEGENVWSYTFDDCPIGVAALKVTFVLGNETAANWTYQHGGYTGETFNSWDAYDFDVAETGDLTYDPVFDSQP